MTRQTWLLAGGALVALVAWFVLRPAGEERVAADLIAQFDSASEKRPNAEVFSLVDATLGGDTRRAVLVREPSRLVYDVTVPDDGELRFSIGLLESEWTTEGDGVLFRVLVGASGPPEEFINVVLDPFHKPGDRGWLPLTVDLSEYAGETVKLFFNTNASPPARPPRDDRNGDAALWGDLRIIAR
jgi:hypothetical protein